MASSAFTADIYGFLDDHKTTRQSGAHSPNFSYPTNVHRGDHYAPSIYLTEDARSVPRSRSRRDSTRSYSTATTLQSAIFTDTQSHYSVSTAPPLRGPPPMRNQRPDVLLPRDNAPHPPQRVPCEFWRWEACNFEFEPSDIEAYVQHTALQHWEKLFPTVCLCWFCDEAAFEAGVDGDTEGCFRARMAHIADHYDNDMTLRSPRLDFHLISHLYDNGLITENAYQTLPAMTELPQWMRRHAGSSTPRTPQPRIDAREELSSPRRRDRTYTGRRR